MSHMGSWESGARHIVRTSLIFFTVVAVGGLLIELNVGSRNVWVAIFFGLICASALTYKGVGTMREIRRRQDVDGHTSN
jgi:hypothetical protein